MCLKVCVLFCGFFFFLTLICVKGWISKDLLELSYLSTIKCGETVTHTEHMLLCTSIVSSVQEQNTHFWQTPILFWTFMYLPAMTNQYLNKYFSYYSYGNAFLKGFLWVLIHLCFPNLYIPVKIWTVIHLKASKDMKDN